MSADDFGLDKLNLKVQQLVHDAFQQVYAAEAEKSSLLQQKLSDAEAENSSLQQQLHDERERAAATQQRLAAAKAKKGHLKRRLPKLQRRLQEQCTKATAAEAQAADLQQRLLEAEAELAKERLFRQAALPLLALDTAGGSLGLAGAAEGGGGMEGSSPAPRGSGGRPSASPAGAVGQMGPPPAASKRQMPAGEAEAGQPSGKWQRVGAAPDSVLSSRGMLAAEQVSRSSRHVRTACAPVSRPCMASCSVD